VTHDAKGYLAINPHTFIQDLKAHFDRFVARLKDPANDKLRARFKEVFDQEGFENRPSKKSSKSKANSGKPASTSPKP